MWYYYTEYIFVVLYLRQSANSILDGEAWKKGSPFLPMWLKKAPTSHELVNQYNDLVSQNDDFKIMTLYLKNKITHYFEKLSYYVEILGHYFEKLTGFFLNLTTYLFNYRMCK